MKNRLTKLKLAASMALCLMSAACASHNDAPTPLPPMAPVQPYGEPEDFAANPGSIYSESASTLLFEDARARRVGDIILINIVENTKSKSKAETSADKNTSLSLGVSAFMGNSSFRPFGVGPSGSVGANPMIGATSTSGHDATGETKRENYVTTTIGARVLQVLPNGILQVGGAREIRVNNETEYMVITGLVRTSDVLSDNSVLSTQLADSKISYYGKGILADKQKPGWLTRILDNIWPF